jgi:4-aminobutyrate aminotransferase / (S)-3-amino-2-methylpropionate transaminase / 5-aminovalerate transaminase
MAGRRDVPLRWQRANGSRIVDEQGHRYVDFSSGIIVANVGHGAPEVRGAISELLDRPLLHCFHHDFAEKAALSEELLDFAGGAYATVHYGATGTGVIETALRLCARHARCRNVPLRVGSFTGSFHGKSLGAAILGDISRYRCAELVGAPPWAVKLPFPDTPKRGELMMQQLTTQPEALSAVFLECTQGSTLRSLDAGALAALDTYCKRWQALVVCDEIQTGFYRSGRRFAYQGLGVEPDVVCLGKGLTSSLPLAALLLKADAARRLDPSLDSETHMANPLSIAAARACLRIYRSETFTSRLRATQAAFSRQLDRVRRRIPGVVVRPTGGLLAGLELSPPAAGGAMAAAVVRNCREAGLLLGGPIGEAQNIIKLAPPLVISEAEMQYGFDVLVAALGRCLPQKER